MKYFIKILLVFLLIPRLHAKIMSGLLILIAVIVLITLESCNKEDEVIQFDPPQISILSGSSGAVERGDHITINLKLEAEAVIDNLTLNGELVEGVDKGETEQLISVTIETNNENALGNSRYEFLLTDQQGESSSAIFTLSISVGTTVLSDSVSLYDNSVLIDQSVELSSTRDELESGTFKFRSTDLDISAGDVIAGPHNGGFLRIVESVQSSGEHTTLTTRQGILTDLFRKADIELDFGTLIENTSGRTLSETSFRRDFANLRIVEKNGSFVTVNGFVELDANYNLDLKIENGLLKSATFATTGTTLDLSLLTTVKVSDNLEVTNSEYEIFLLSKSFYSVSPPVYGTVNFKLKSAVSSTIGASVSADITTRDKVQIDFNASYSSGNWTKSFNSVELINEGSVDLSGVINISSEITLIPEIDIKLYGVSGPFFKPEAFATLDLGIASPRLDWDALSEIGYRGSFGFRSDILGDILGSESTIAEQKFKVWEAPQSIEIVSGNDQQIPQNSQSKPLKVNALDNLGNPVAGVPVYYEITEGGGTVAPVTVTTDSNGSSESVYSGSDISESILISSEIRNRNSEPIDATNFNLSVQKQVPSLTTAVVTSITQNSALSGGNITNDGGSTVTARGIVWSTSTQPTIALSTKTVNGTGIGAFTSSITNLQANTKYYVRAYATNNNGTAYGNEVEFASTTQSLPTITTNPAISITSNAATSGGTITSDGGSSITARGVVWSTTTQPTISLATKTSNGTGTGTFTSSITNLTENTKYYVRGYATNTIGTTYGNEIEFTTTQTPVVSLIDTRDGQVYPVVKIGLQYWMQKNLNYTVGNSWCYGDNPQLCNTFGRLYDRNTALTACPPGWHLPNKSEWQIMIDYLGGWDVAGGKMKSITGGWAAPNTGATNESGFSAIPSGNKNINNLYYDATFGASWFVADYDYPVSVNTWSAGASFGGNSLGMSCRCVKD